MGSIKSKGNNKYELTVSAGVGLNAKRQRYYKTIEASSLKQAEKALIQFQAQVDSGNHLKSEKVTFENFATDWIKKYAEPNLAPKTVSHYKDLLTLRLIPAFGKLTLEKIKPMHLLEFYENLRENGIRKDGKIGGLSSNSIGHYHRLLSSMFDHAVRWQMMKENIAKKISPPKSKAKRSKYYDSDQIKLLIEHINTVPEKYKVGVMLTIYTGFRREELMGLKWDDVDAKNNIIHTRNTSQYIKGVGTVITDDMKNESSNRKVSVPKFIIELLMGFKSIQNEMRLKCNDIWHESDMVFVQDNGLPMHPETISAWFNAFVKKKGLPPITFHGLRHSHATILIANNTDVVTVSRRLGHSKTSTTLDIYAHAFSTAEQTLSDKMEQLLKSEKIETVGKVSVEMKKVSR